MWPVYDIKWDKYMSSEKINEIIAKKLNKEASPQEERDLDQWLVQSVENQQVFDLIKKEWDYSKPIYKIVNSDELRNRIWKEGLADVKYERQQMPQSRSISFYLKIAAAILVLALSTYVLVKDPQPYTTTPVEWITKSNPSGQKSKVFLPDGSEVWLNSNSSLRYTSDFTDSARVISLEGEAYFEVAHDANRPFTVLAGNISTTVLGTSFNIDAFSEDVQVSLVSGKVLVSEVDSINQNGDYLVLNPGQAAVFLHDAKKMVVREFDINVITGWKNGELYFQDASFDEIISKLELWYGVSFNIDEQVNIRKSYTGKFTNESLRNVMESISFSLNFDFEMKDKKVSITRK
jgi:transmembrane sensor